MNILEFYKIFIITFTSLFSIINPIGMSVIFASITKKYSKKEHNEMAYRVAIYGALLLSVIFFIGPYILKFFGLSLLSVQVAGGMLIIYSAWKMINEAADTSSPETQQDFVKVKKNANIAFYPLTMPLTAGPGAWAVILSIRIKDVSNLDIINSTAFLLGVIVLFILIYLCYRFADVIFDKLSLNGINTITNLAAFILLALGVSIFFHGVNGLLLPVH